MRTLYYFLMLVLSVGLTSTANAQCQANETEIEVDITPDNWGSEITWDITGIGGTPTYGNGGPYTDNNTTPINVKVCVPTGTQVVFTIYDGYGDGICCSQGNGSYTVRIGTTIVASGGSYASSESTTFFAPTLAYDVTMEEIMTPFPLVGSAEVITVNSNLKNTSATTITELSLSYQAGTEPVVTENFTGLNIPPAGKYNLSFATLWTPLNLGAQDMRVWVNNINTTNADMYAGNDTISRSMVVYQTTTTPNILNSFLTGTPTYVTVLTSADQLDKPTDLDFHSILSLKELWVLNENTESSGGSTVTVSDAGSASQSSQWRRDGNAWHFMSLPTALAFGTNGNWANSPGVYDANHNGGAPFTGPSLWSSDQAIYAQNAGPGTNGSHLDMLHESPYAMGIAHHKDNAYWVFDGNSGDIVYYDFAKDHGPGNSYHGDALIRRYPVSVLKDGDVPSHLILNKTNGWLYIVDTGNDRVLRMNTATGTVQSGLTGYETVEEYSQMTGVVSEVAIDTGLTQPCGIDLVDNNLIVGDYTTGDIRFYDVSVNPATYLGKISTGAAGLTGLKVGPDGNIWYTNRLTNEVKRIEPALATGLQSVKEELEIKVFPNPASEQVNVELPEVLANNTQVRVLDALGRTVLETETQNKTMLIFDSANWAEGIYSINFSNTDYNKTKLIRVARK
ncbi:MAG: T9SS type A sorting domain-containing protein [Aureispira sp.]|nr:T9SS type A sorting domain-containing protein [Aureispira sp.]